jgi:hypothetical protein
MADDKEGNENNKESDKRVTEENTKDIWMNKKQGRPVWK